MPGRNCFLRLFDFEGRELAARPGCPCTRYYHSYEARGAQSQWVCSFEAGAAASDRSARTDAPGLVHIGEPGVETFPGWNSD